MHKDIYVIGKKPINKLKATKYSAEIDASLDVKFSQHQKPTIIAHIKEVLMRQKDVEINKAQTMLHKVQQTVDTSIMALSSQATKNSLHANTPKLNDFNVSEKTCEIRDLQCLFDARNNDFLSFKKQNHIPYLPIRSDKGASIQVVIAILLWIIESTTNIFMFKEVSGLQTALVLGITQATVNISIGYLIGKFIITRAMHGKTWGTKIMSWLAFLCYLAFVFWMNLGLGVYRSISVSDPMATALDPSKLLIASSPFSNLDSLEMTSILVITLGLIFSFAAFIDGFMSDDPHPGYGEKYREVLKAKSKIFKTTRRLNHDFNDIKIEFINAHLATNSEGLRILNQWSNAINNIDKFFNDYRNMLESYEIEFRDHLNCYNVNFNSMTTNHDPIALNYPLLSEKDHKIELIFSDAIQYFLTDQDRRLKLIDLHKEHEKNLAIACEEVKAEIKLYEQNIEEINVLNKQMIIGLL